MLLLLSAPVQPLVGELGSRKPRGVAKKNFSIKKIKVNKRPEETSHLNSHYTDASFCVDISFQLIRVSNKEHD